MHNFIELLFRGVMYVFFGCIMELLASSIHNFIDNGFNKKTIAMEGNCSIWMSIPYAICFLFLLEPMISLVSFLPIWIQFMIFGFLFCLIEWVLGWIFYKILNTNLWDYSKESDSIGKWTRLGLFFQWGWCFLWLKSYIAFIMYLGQYVPVYFGY